MKDVHLLPYILPNVFVISTSLSSHQFAQQVLPSLKPLFAVKEPPQNMLTLLDNLEMLRSKTEKNVFRHGEYHGISWKTTAYGVPIQRCPSASLQCVGI